MNSLEEELMKVGSYFVKKGEVLIDPGQRPVPIRDRQEMLFDILLREADFQF